MANQIKRVICLALKELLKQNIILQKWPGEMYTHTHKCVCAENQRVERERVAERKKLIFFFPHQFFVMKISIIGFLGALADTYLRIYLSSFLF
jgi:hypothetical protein